MNRVTLAAVAAVCLLFAIAAPSRAAVIYSNVPDLSSSQLANCAYNTVCGPKLFGRTAFAAQAFTLAAPATVGVISYNAIVSLGIYATGANYVILSADGAGGLPGTVVAHGADIALTVTTGPIGVNNPTTDYSFEIDPLWLAAGSYYVAIQDITTNQFDFLSKGVATSGAAQSNDGGSTWALKYEVFTSVAVSLSTPLPEPTSMALLGVGVAGLSLRRRRA